MTISVDDPYRTLQVEPHADLEAIRTAYRRLARLYHPDLNSRPEAAERMRAINAAYALLTLLWWRALKTKLTPDAALIAAVAIAIGYSATDEFHQSFVTGRHGSPVDVLIDSVGVVAVATLIARRTRQTAK